MPYSYPNDIPDTIKNIPAGAQKIWVSTFNSVVDGGGTEDSARQASWVQVKAKYKKQADGSWVKKELENKQGNKNMPKRIINTTKDKGFFKAFIPLTVKNNKCEILEKKVGDVTVKYLRGIATNTKIDKEDDRMSKSFVKKIKDSLTGMNVFTEHEHTIEKTLGYVDETSGGEEEVIVDAALEPEESNPLVKSILAKIAHGTKIGYSVGGKITEATIEMSKDVGRNIREIVDGDIYEVSLTAMPAGDVGFVGAIQKSFVNLMKYVDEDGNLNIPSEHQIEKDVTNISTTIEKTVPDPNDDHPEIDSDKGSSHQDETTPELKKALEEMMESDALKNKLYDLFWSFRVAIREIVESDLEPAMKKDKIIMLGTEFGSKVEEMSVAIATLEAQIAAELS